MDSQTVQPISTRCSQRVCAHTVTAHVGISNTTQEIVVMERKAPEGHNGVAFHASDVEAS